MATAIRKTADINGIFQYVEAINPADYPVIDWEPDPDVSGVAGISRNYWKYDGTNVVVEMTQPEKDSVDAFVNVPLDFDDEEDILCRNETGATILRGTPVYLTGVVGMGNKDLIATADGSSEATIPAIGLLINDTPDGTNAAAKFRKELQDFDTSAWLKDALLYVANGGGLTNVRPTNDNFLQTVGTVKESKLDGKIAVDMTTPVIAPPNSSSVVFTKTNFTTPAWNPATEAPTQANGTQIGSVAITPRFADDKIYIECSLCWDGDADKDMAVSVWRDTTLIGVIAANVGNRTKFNYLHFTVEDAPNSIVSTIYALHIHGDAVSTFINQNKDGDDAGGTLGLGTGLFLRETT